MPVLKPPLSDLLPDGFEDLSYVTKLRVSVLRRLEEGSPAVGAGELLPLACSKDERCLSGLCPICVRKLRCLLVRGCHDFLLHELQWVALTVVFPHLTIDAGDHRRLLNRTETLCKIPEVTRLITTLRREHQRSDYHGPFICVGSVEAGLKIVGRERQPKRFHIHLMISGLSYDSIAEIADNYFSCYRSSALANPVKVQAVDPGWESFVDTMTYSYKQPYIKKSFANRETTRYDAQRPKVYELVEMASNLGPHRCTDRLILAGIQIRGSRFQLTPNAIEPLKRQLQINAPRLSQPLRKAISE